MDTPDRRAQGETRATHRSARPPRQRAGGPAGLDARRVAAALLQKVVHGRAPLDALVDETGGVPAFRALSSRDRALVRAILATSLRHRGTLQSAIERRLERPLAREATPLLAHLHVGAAQLLFLDVPDHAAVSLAVAGVAEDRRIERAAPLANGLLRRIARERHDILAERRAPGGDAPAWLYARWAAHYGEETAAAIADAHRVPPMLDLTPRDDAARVAGETGGVRLATGSVRLRDAPPVTALAGYGDGAWWVQDAAAALPARLVGAAPGLKVADLCAAPGGKTMQLAAAGATVTAVERARSRLKRLAANLARVRLDATLVEGDVLEWTPDAPFDAVLLDAPCTATGTIRRHPDVQWVKTPDEIVSARRLQERMLDRAAGTVRPGGALVFCTCSLEPEEGEAHVAPFLARYPDYALDPVRPDEIGGLAHAIAGDGWLRTLPCHGAGPTDEPLSRGMDGFFAARFRRRG